MITLNTVFSKDDKTKKAKRIGRGPGSGKGTTSGYGHKGARSRSGRKRKAYFEGGQNPISIKVPKRGFNNKRFRTDYQIINLSALSAVAETTDTIDKKTLVNHKLLDSTEVAVKILGNGELSKAVTIRADKFSKGAREKIEQINGKIEEL